MTRNEFHAHVSQSDEGFTIKIEEIEYVNFLVSEKDLIDTEIKRWINELEELELSDIIVSYIWENSAQSA